MTDIVEMLGLIPETVSTAGKGGVHCPVGKWCHEARNEILRLRKEGEKYRRISELKSHAIDRYIPCPDHRDKRNRDDECEMCRRERAERRATRAEGRVEELTKALEKARIAIAAWSPNPTEPLEEIDGILSSTERQNGR